MNATPLDSKTALPDQAPARPLRVAIVTAHWDRGGTEAQTAALARGLAAAGVDVDVFVLSGNGAPTLMGSAQVASLGPSRRRNGIPGAVQMLAVAVRTRRRLRQGQYDVVHATLARAHTLVPLLCGGPRRPLVVSWRRNLGIHTRSRPAAALLELVAAWRTDVIVCNSTVVADYWRQRGHFRRARAAVVPNSLEPMRFEAVCPMRVGPAALGVVSVGGLREVKGHALLLQAVADVRGAGHDVGLVILGEGDQRERLETTAARLGVPLLLPGTVEDTRPWLAGATVYVHPSLSEGSSNALAEAMAQGCAIVTTGSGDARVLVGDTAEVVATGNSVAITRGINALLADEDRRQDLGRRAQMRASELWRLEQVVEQHLDIYASSRL